MVNSIWLIPGDTEPQSSMAKLLLRFAVLLSVSTSLSMCVLYGLGIFRAIYCHSFFCLLIVVMLADLFLKLNSRYKPEVGDIIVGRVLEVKRKFYASLI